MLYSAHWMTSKNDAWFHMHYTDTMLKPYRKTHYNHPTSKWVRQCSSNYRYACIQGLHLCREYTRRYSKIHACQVRLEWLLKNPPSEYAGEPINAYLAQINVPIGCTAIPLAMPIEYHQPDAISAYRSYYIGEKSRMQTSVEDENRLLSIISLK